MTMGTDLRPHDPRARILLVDDTELNRDLVGAILMAAGFAVDVAGDGETAWELTWSKRYDLVLMDLDRPGMRGCEAAARTRAREGVMSGGPIAALTATHEPDAEQFSLWSGIDEYIAKPVDPGTLVSRVEAILAERHTTDDDWAPVWRLHAFADWTAHLGETASADCLDELDALMSEAAEAIHVHDTASERFLRTITKLRDLAQRYGFDEITGIGSFYGVARPGRSRDPNLLGAIGRARYAIKVYRQEHTPAPCPDRVRSRISVQSLFGGRQAA